MAESTDIHINLRGQFGYQNANIHTSKILGTGSYGSVVKATLDHLPCAAKILHTIFFRDDDPGAVDFAARFELECNILRDLKHPCIVQFLGVVQDPTHHRPILLMELMDESLTHFLEHSPSSLLYHTQVNITYDIAQALAYLHSNRIIHRDLSSNNILLKGGIQAKVTDFGISKIVDANPGMTRNKVSQCPGTPAFMPPEALRAKPRYSDKLDTFSLGVLIVQIITRKFPAPTDAEIVMEDDSSPTGEKIVPVPELERRKDDIAKVSSDHALLPIALHCLKDRDRERPTAAQLCQRLGQLKTAQAYTASERESQARRVSFEQQLSQKEEEKAAEIAQLQEQMSQLAREKGQLAAEKEHLASKQEREVAELRHQLQTSQRASVQNKRKSFFGFFSKYKSNKDEKALYDAAQRGDVSTVRRLIGSNVNIDCTPYQNGWTLLMTASFEGHVDIVRILIEAKAQINAQEEDGGTALHLAAQEGKVDVVRLLTEAQAQVNIQIENGATPLYVASLNGHSDVVSILMRNGADVNMAAEDGATPLIAASQNGHSDVVNILIMKSAALTAMNNGETPLFFASHNGHSDVVNILIRNGAGVNMAANDGATPLFMASQNGHSDVVNILIRNGADVNLSWEGLKPIDSARSEGHTAIVQLLKRRH